MTLSPRPPTLSFQFSLPLSPPVRCKTRSIGERSSSGHFNYLVPPLTFLFLSLYLPFFNVLSLSLPLPNIHKTLLYFFLLNRPFAKDIKTNAKKKNSRFLCDGPRGAFVPRSFSLSAAGWVQYIDSPTDNGGRPASASQRKKKKRKKLTTMELRRSSLLGCYRSSPPKLFVASGGFE